MDNATALVRDRRYEQVVDLAVRVLEAPSGQEVWRAVADTMLDLWDGTALVMKGGGWTPDAGEVRVWRRDRGPTALDPVTSRQVRAGFPFAGHYGAGRDRTPMTAAQIAGGRAWRDSETASVLRGSLDTEHVLAVPLRQLDGHVLGFLVHRAGRDFTDRERELAARLQPLLAAAMVHARTLTTSPPPPPPSASAVVERPGVPVPELTARERTVLALLAQGLTATALARRLGSSPRTVHKHAQNVYRKLNASDRLSAVLRAQELGLLPVGRCRCPGPGCAGGAAPAGAGPVRCGGPAVGVPRDGRG